MLLGPSKKSHKNHQDHEISDERWPSAPNVTAIAWTVAPVIEVNNTANSTKNDTTTNVKIPKYSFPKFVGEPPKYPIPHAPSCGISRRAKSAKETVYMTVDDGPSASGRIFLLRAMDQLNNRTDKNGKPVTPAYVSFMESGYNFCGRETVSVATLNCDPEAYEMTLELLVWTVKAGHVLAAHSDSHFYDAKAGFCNYVTMPAQTKVEEKFAKCGKDTTWSDFVRGALRVEAALSNETVWETDAERALAKKAISDIWTYARLPCTNYWKLPGVSMVTGLRKEDGGPERDMRIKTGDMLFGGKLECKPDSKPWNVYGWDCEWRVNAKATYDTQKEKCRVVQDIVNQFDNKWKTGPKGDHVVLLTHDYFFADTAKAAMFRDVIAELQFLGYTIGTIDQYPIN